MPPTYGSRRAAAFRAWRRDPGPAYRRGRGPSAGLLHKPDDLGFLGLVVPDEQITPFFQLGVDELIQGDGAVHQVRLGQTGPVLEVLQILRGLWYQGNSDPVSKRLPGNVSPREAVTRASRHRYGPPSKGLRCGLD